MYGGLPPDDEVDVLPWGIDVSAQPSVPDVLVARRDRMAAVNDVIDRLTPSEYSRICAQHPGPGFPPVTSFPVGFCPDVVIGEEWAHHTFAVRDLARLERAT